MPNLRLKVIPGAAVMTTMILHRRQHQQLQPQPGQLQQPQPQSELASPQQFGHPVAHLKVGSFCLVIPMGHQLVRLLTRQASADDLPRLTSRLVIQEAVPTISTLSKSII